MYGLGVEPDVSLYLPLPSLLPAICHNMLNRLNNDTLRNALRTAFALLNKLHTLHDSLPNNKGTKRTQSIVCVADTLIG